MKMLKTLAAALAVCAAVTVQARPLEDIQKSGTIILASEGQYAPFNFFQGKQLTGYEIEVGEAVGKKMGADKGTSKYLYGLFPYGPAKQACRYAGLPKPTGCV